MKNNFISKIYAFTLAEVLITIAIIGFVAVTILGIIIPKFEDMQYTSGLKAAYKTISEATEQIRTDNGGSLVDVFTSLTVARTEYLKYLKYTKTCDGNAILGDCWYSGYAKRFDNGQLFTGGGVGAEVSWWGINGARAVVLIDGKTLYFGSNAPNPNCTETSDCVRIFVDINGLKEPNTMGKDIYYFFIYSNRVSANGWDATPGSGGRGETMGKWRLLQ